MKNLLTIAVLAGCVTFAFAAESPSPDIETLRSVEAKDSNTADARAALKSLTSGGASNLLPILQGFDGTSVIAQNYLRNAFESIAAAELKAGRTLPEEPFVAFITDASQSPAARRLAYEWLLKQNPDVEEQLIPQMLLDPSPEFRRDAVARLITQAESTDQQADAAKLFRQALQGAVHEDQVKTISVALRDAGEDVNLQRHFGFLTNWQVIGPFDNKDMKGFAVAYPPEEELNLNASYEGQLGNVSWQPISTDDDYGRVDIAKSLENYKGSLMYLTTTFSSGSDQEVELRLGTQNAWKLWVNGDLVFEREEYHRSSRMDQYKVPVALNAGANVILLKLCQNEMEEDWAQDYHVQLRVCDSSGSAVLPAE